LRSAGSKLLACAGLRLTGVAVAALLVLAAFVAALLPEITAGGASTQTKLMFAGAVLAGIALILWLARRDRIALAAFGALLAALILAAAGFVAVISGATVGVVVALNFACLLLAGSALYLFRQRSPREPLEDLLRQRVHEASVREDNGVEMGIRVPEQIAAGEIAYFAFVLQSCVAATRKVRVQISADTLRLGRPPLSWADPPLIELAPAEVCELLVPVCAVAAKRNTVRVYPSFRATGTAGVRLRPWRAPGAVPPPRLWQSLLGVGFFLPFGDVKTDFDEGHLFFDVAIHGSTETPPELPDARQLILYRQPSALD